MDNIKNKMRIYFLGSGKIAVPVLEAVAKSENINLVGVGTQPDQPSGRKKKLLPTPVGLWAEEHGIDVDKPVSVNNPAYRTKLEELSPDFILVVSFGQLLKKKILELPKLYCINVHASLLPKYRGASPIVAPILNGDEKTGVAIMEMERGLDTGPVFASYEYSINGTENADELEMILGKLAAENIDDVLMKIYHENLQPVAQEHSDATYVGKIMKQDGLADWSFDAAKIERMSRAYYPWPGAYFFLNMGNDKKKKIQITQAAVCDNNKNYKPGQVLKADKKNWIIACGNNALKIERLIPEGKKEMSGADFLRGCKVEEGSFV